MSLFNTVNKLVHSYRKFSSALYITADKAQKQFALLTPVIDFDDQLKHKEVLAENIQLRQLPLNLDAIEDRWKFFREIESKRITLENTKSEIAKQISTLMKSQNSKLNTEIHKLKLHLDIVKGDLKSLRSTCYRIEEGAVLQALSLPNKLHKKTPESTTQEVYRYREKSDHMSESHLKIGREKGWINFINPMSCYLAGEAALFEQAIENYFSDELCEKYTQFSNSDLVKSIVVEGCGSDPFSPSKVLTLEDIHCIRCEGLNKVHLVGGSSLFAFMAYFTKHLVIPTQFPIKAFCIGRSYRSVNEHESLFNLNQSSDVGLFIATNDDADLVENIVKEVVEVYRPLGFHFRIALLEAKNLERSESLRISIQMFSNHQQSYVEVGNVSFYEDYLSKRLLFSYNQKGDRKFPSVIAGSLINIHKVIGCLLENNNSKDTGLLMNDFLTKYV